MFGYAFDENWRPLAGVRAALGTRSEWAPGIDTPRIGPDGFVPAFECVTGSDGRFELAVPTPTSAWVDFELRPDLHRALVEEHLRWPDSLRLREGDNDFGEFVLGPAGALTGRVVDDHGAPVDGAVVRLDHRIDPHNNHWYQTRSRTDGSWTLGNLPGGTHPVQAHGTGYEPSRPIQCEITVGSTVRAPELVLELVRPPGNPEDTIAGAVVDEHGAPIRGAFVVGTPTGDGRNCCAETGEQGLFVLVPRQQGRHIVTVSAKGFAPHGAPEQVSLLLARRRALAEDAEPGRAAAASDAHSGGEKGLRFVLKRLPSTTFVVLDDATSEPVTRYRLTMTFQERSLPDGTKMTTTGGGPEYEVADRPRGEFECVAEPGIQGYRIEAPGYAPFEAVVVHESGTNRCVARLAPGGSLAGRAVLEGVPARNVTIVLRDELARERCGEFTDENDVYWYEGEPTSPFFADRRSREIVVRESGAFRFDSLAPGDYRLEIVTDAGDRRALEPIGVAAGPTTELGDVELVRAGKLVGHVLVPAGCSPRGIEVRSSAFDIPEDAKTDADGRFTLQRRPAGRVGLAFLPRDGSFAFGPLVFVELKPGETKEIEIDLRDRAR